MSSKYNVCCLIVLILASLLTGCDDQSTDLEKLQTVDEYLVFGSFAGFCGGEACIEIFKIENGRLYEDGTDQYPSSDRLPYEGQFKLLSAEKYELVTDLLESFPEKLTEEISLVLGMPDAYDQGGLYIEIKRNEKIQYWVLDRDKDNIPEYLHSWVDLINEKVNLLR